MGEDLRTEVHDDLLRRNAVRAHGSMAWHQARSEYPTEVAPRPGHVEPNVGAIAFLA